MLRSRFFPALFSASLVLAVACSDTVAPGSPPASVARAHPEPALVTLSGTIHMSGMDLYPVVLSTSDGTDIPLAGDNAILLVSLANDGVDVRGEWNGAADFRVADFLVRTVDGGPVVDGILIALYEDLIDLGDPIGYGIRPTDGGSIVLLTDPSPDLLIHLNQRLWVAGAGNGQAPSAFGVIGES